MPGWQLFYEEHAGEDFDILSIALDGQGPDAPRPYHEQANAEFTTVVDQYGEFASLYGLRAVPFGILIDEQGRIVRGPDSISVSNEDTLAELEAWLAGESIERSAVSSIRDASTPEIREADLRFALGSLLLTRGRTDEAVAEWRAALVLDPDNWIIHKQIWAVEHPEAFYDGGVDYGWQREELDREAAAN